MSGDLNLGREAEAFIEGQLASGRYAEAGDVVRDALRLLEERQGRLDAIEASVARGLADLAAGRVYDMDEVFDEIEAEIERTPTASDR